jgi:hypothetical protein
VFVYLNLNVDYRGSTNITLVLVLSTIEVYWYAYNSPPDANFKNKTLELTGKVDRIKIDLYKNEKTLKSIIFKRVVELLL